jgi:hypothetical protein
MSNERFITLIKMREVTNVLTGEKTTYPNEYYVFDNEKNQEVVIPNFKPTCYEHVRVKATELNNALEQSRDLARQNQINDVKTLYQAINALLNVAVDVGFNTHEIHNVWVPKLRSKIHNYPQDIQDEAIEWA